MTDHPRPSRRLELTVKVVLNLATHYVTVTLLHLDPVLVSQLEVAVQRSAPYVAMNLAKAAEAECLGWERRTSRQRHRGRHRRE